MNTQRTCKSELCVCASVTFFFQWTIKDSFFFKKKEGLILSKLHLYTIRLSRLNIWFLKEIFIALLTEITRISAADLVHDFLSMFLIMDSQPKNWCFSGSELKMC